MGNTIAKALKLKHEPVAILWSDEKPDNAIQFREGQWGCVMWMFAMAAKGKTVISDRKTFGCFGEGVGLGFENQFENFPGWMPPDRNICLQRSEIFAVPFEMFSRNGYLAEAYGMLC
ncbi:DUF169 domain-containing protein [Archaeoglobus sp.]